MTQYVRTMLTTDQRNAKITRIAECPPALTAAVAGLTDAQLDTPYRDGGWTVRQVVHHVADSHANAYLRFRWVVAEENTTLKTYDQDVWANFEDMKEPVDSSLKLLEGLHHRWVAFLSSLPESAWSKTALHPERGEINLEDLLETYSEHGAKHTKQITDLRARRGW